jgi:hypothetical protein
MSTADAYKKHTHREHILELPDTYIGSVETHDEMRWVFDAEKGKMVYRHCAFNPGFYKPDFTREELLRDNGYTDGTVEINFLELFTGTVLNLEFMSKGGFE